MAVLTFAGFAGENRALHPLLLPENTGTVSLNQKPGRGDLRPWSAPMPVATVPAGRKSIYRMGRDVASDTNYWLSWPTIVHAVVGGNAADTSERTYYTGDGTPKWTDSTRALASAPYPTAARELGVPIPMTPALVSVVDPVLGVAVPWQPARTETLVAPRQITKVSVYDEQTLLDNITVARVWLNDLTGFAGMGFENVPKIVLQCLEFPSINSANARPIRVFAGYVEFLVARGTPTFAEAPATGTVTLSGDTVSYPEVQEIKADATTLGTRESVFYTYTYVSDAGEESAPAPPSSMVSAYPNSTITLGLFAAPPAGAYGISRIRIYRTQANSGGGADFFFLREIGVGTASTTDDGRDLGEVLPTTTWLPPPADLAWLTGLWNGMMAGISGRSVRFCEAYTYYAWPMAYEVLPMNAQPVALATFGQTLVMLTDGNPSVITGGSPESMDEQPVEFYQACVSPLSAVGMGHGVAWASPDGLAYLGSGGPRMLTDGLMTREDWQALKPETIQGCMYEGRYFGFYNDGARKGFVLDPANPQGIYFLDFGVDAVHVDALQDALFVLDGVNIKKWDAGDALTVTFKSKVFHQTKPVPGFACAEVVGSYPATFKLYADGVLKHTQTVTSANPFRLPGGYHGQDFQIEVSTTGAIQGVAVAHSMRELAQT